MKTEAKTIKELMIAWSTKRAEWIAAKGSDAGFAEWFTVQVTGGAK